MSSPDVWALLAVGTVWCPVSSGMNVSSPTPPCTLGRVSLHEMDHAPFGDARDRAMGRAKTRHPDRLDGRSRWRLGVGAAAGRALDAAAHARDRDRLVASKSQQAQIWTWTRHARVTETVTLFRALCYWGRSLTRAASGANTLVIGRPRVATPSPAGPFSSQASAG